MRTTVDNAGRLVIPKSLRDRIGLRPGEVELSDDGAAVRIVPVHSDDLVEEDGHLIIPASGTPIEDDLISALRRADQR